MTNTPLRILGIDPGTAIVGWAIIEEDAQRCLQAVAFGCITTASTQALPERLGEIALDLSEIIDAYTPTECSIEELFYFRNQTTILPVAQARGVLLLTAWQKGLKVAEYTPLQVKQAVSGYGRADKKQIQQLVTHIFHLPSIPHPDDAADALAIAYCHYASRMFHKNNS